MSMKDVLSDARLSVRMLWRSAGFTFAALAALNPWRVPVIS